MATNITVVEILDRGTGAIVETVRVDAAALQVAQATNRDSRDIELELRGGIQQSTADFVYRPTK